MVAAVVSTNTAFFMSEAFPSSRNSNTPGGQWLHDMRPAACACPSGGYHVLTTTQILYRMPDHPSLLQTYVGQNYDLFPKFRHSRISSPLAGKTRCSTR